MEKAVSAVDGVKNYSVNLLTNSMSVDGTASNADIIAAVEAAGYGARLKTESAVSTHTEKREELRDTQTPLMKKRLISSLIVLAALMYVSMGHVMWGFPLPAVLAGNPLAIGLLQMLLCAIVMVINQKFFISGTKGVLHGAPNMDTLVAMGSGASFVYSTYVLFAMTAAQTSGDSSAVMHGLHDLYFESAAMILTLVTLGKWLEEKSKRKTGDEIEKLIKLMPNTVTILTENGEKTVTLFEEFAKKEGLSFFR